MIFSLLPGPGPRAIEGNAMANKESKGSKARERSAQDSYDTDGIADEDAFALPIGHGFSEAMAPIADEGVDGAGEAASSAIDEIGPEKWTPPFYLRYPLATLGGVVLSGVWLSASAYFIDRQILWPDLLALLPHEMGGGWRPAC